MSVLGPLQPLEWATMGFLGDTDFVPSFSWVLGLG